MPKAGTYRGQCVELCGRDHGFMPIVTKAVSKEEFQTWLKQTAASQKQASAGGTAPAQPEAAPAPAVANAG